MDTLVPLHCTAPVPHRVQRVVLIQIQVSLRSVARLHGSQEASRPVHRACVQSWLEKWVQTALGHGGSAAWLDDFLFSCLTSEILKSVTFLFLFCPSSKQRDRKLTFPPLTSGDSNQRRPRLWVRAYCPTIHRAEPGSFPYLSEATSGLCESSSIHPREPCHGNNMPYCVFLGCASQEPSPHGTDTPSAPASTFCQRQKKKLSWPWEKLKSSPLRIFSVFFIPVCPNLYMMTVPGVSRQGS